MCDTFFSNKYLILLLSFFSPMIINIGGEVSPSFLFILVTIPFWYKYLDFKNDLVLKDFAPLFFIIIGVQLIWMLFTKVDLFLQVKGLLITVSGLLQFSFYYFVYRNNIGAIKWAALGTFLSSFIFTNVLAEIAGGEFGMWKFQIFPRLVSGSVLFYLWFCDKKWIKDLSPIMLIVIGGIGLMTGARSSGLAPFSAGLFTLILLRSKNIKLGKIKMYMLIGVLLLYGAYALIYVPNVQNGNITGGNTKQLNATENPYNPINLLIIGRTDAIVPFIAFADKPLTGWGYNTKDPNGRYHRLLAEIGNKKEKRQIYKNLSSYIPGHSVLGYYSCSYGIVVFITLVLLLYRTWKYVYMSLLVNNKYLLYRLFCFITLTWNFLFSPISHFKWLPSTIAVVVVLSISALNEYLNDIKVKQLISKAE